MIPDFESNGNLPRGVHEAVWSEFAARFGKSVHRRVLLSGLAKGLRLLKAAGCEVVYVDGSFVTDREGVYNEVPRDFDVCWDEKDVNVLELDAVFFDFSAQRAAQKERFGGEFFPAKAVAGHKSVFFEYFQIDKSTGRAKGIVKVRLETLP